MLYKSPKQISFCVFIVSMLLVVPGYGITKFKVSNYGGGNQIWFEVEDFDQRDPANESSFALSDVAGAFGRSITCMSGTDGASMIRYTFDISTAGGSGGTWYFWGRVINPNNNSSFMLVDGHPGDQVPFTLPVSGLVNGQRIFEQSGLGNDWVWAPTPGSAGEEAHTKILKEGENTMFILAREAGASWDVFMWTDDPAYVPTDGDYQNAKPPALGKASHPSPADGAADVPRDVVLSWTPGKYAPAVNGHVVYLSENFSDVNDGIGGISQSASSYTPPQRLDFETTYYWRVDEVNAPPSSVVHEGDVWSFTTESFSYPITNITATASSSSANKGPENTVNGSGLDSTGLLHGNIGDNTMWLSDMTGPPPTWIMFEFDKVYKLHEMWVWNSNESLEQVIGLGIKEAVIEYSTDGVDFATLGTTHEFAQGPGTAGYAHNTTIDMAGVPAKFVRLTANSNWKGLLPQFGLSEVRFLSIPLSAREPNPASGATDVAPDAVLTWRSGREAARHDVSLSADEQAVIDGTAPVVSVTSPSYSTPLDLAGTYYWQVTEVNEASTPAAVKGDIWNFSTVEYIVVEDFESYNDIDPPDPDSHRIFESWIDGFGIAANGALVGYDPPQPSYAEKTIVHGGSQAMPLFYSNTAGATFSEAARTFADPQDWTKHGIKTLGLWFHGAAGNAGQLYVKINGTKILYDGSAGNLAGAAWQPWNIDLASAGANLQNVTTLAIGIDGSGAAGTLYFDDIRLYAYERQLITPVQPGSAGLVAYYPLDGNANDTAGGHNGTATAGVSYAPGKIGQAIKLGGYDYVDCGNPSQLNFGTGSWTVSAWVNLAYSLTGANIVFSNGGDDSGGIRYVLSVGQSAAHTITLTVDDNTTKVESIGSVVVDDSQWHHIIGIRDGNSLRIYVDGFQDGSDVALPNGYDLSGTSQANAYIGAGYSFANKIMQKFFTGSIDDVHIYSYALSQAQVAGLAGMTLPFDKPF